MSPADVKAIRILAEHLGLDGVGYNPRLNDFQANKLVEKFGLTIRQQKGKKVGSNRNIGGMGGGWEGFVAYKDGEELAAMGGYGEDDDHRRYAIVHGAAELVKPGWRDDFNCFAEGLDPFKIGHIIDARR